MTNASQEQNTYFVVRETSHPKEDLERNWSAPVGGFFCEDMVNRTYESSEEAEIDWKEKSCSDTPIFKFHPMYSSFVEVHYEGLGAWELEAETLEEAREEGLNYEDSGCGLACTMEKGDGHFFAEDVVSFHVISDERVIFKIKC